MPSTSYSMESIKQRWRAVRTIHPQETPTPQPSLSPPSTHGQPTITKKSPTEVKTPQDEWDVDTVIVTPSFATFKETNEKPERLGKRSHDDAFTEEEYLESAATSSVRELEKEAEGMNPPKLPKGDLKPRKKNINTNAPRRKRAKIMGCALPEKLRVPPKIKHHKKPPTSKLTKATSSRTSSPRSTSCGESGGSASSDDTKTKKVISWLKKTPHVPSSAVEATIDTGAATAATTRDLCVFSEHPASCQSDDFLEGCKTEYPVSEYEDDQIKKYSDYDRHLLRLFVDEFGQTGLHRFDILSIMKGEEGRLNIFLHM